MCKEFMRENIVFINDYFVVFNIIDLDRDAGKITVNITENGHHTIDTFELFDLDSWAYFEYGRPAPEKIYLDDFEEVAYQLRHTFASICDETVKREVVELWMGDSPERLVGKTYVHYTDKFMIEQMNKVNFIIPK